MDRAFLQVDILPIQRDQLTGARARIQGQIEKAFPLDIFKPVEHIQQPRRVRRIQPLRFRRVLARRLDLRTRIDRDIPRTDGIAHHGRQRGVILVLNRAGQPARF